MSEISTIPVHIGIIPDGSRRWAKAKGLPSFKGHEQGFKVFQAISERSFELGVKVFSAWGFSTENWKRPQEEVGYLMKMFLELLQSEVDKLDEKNIKLLISGSREQLGDSLITAINQAEEKTADNTGGIINICLNYGGRKEIIDTVNLLLKEGKKEISEQDFDSHLYHQLPDLDLIIRTAGERRLSGFMPWQGVYSELYFSDLLYPDFTVGELEKALADFASRKRTFGGN